MPEEGEQRHAPAPIPMHVVMIASRTGEFVKLKPWGPDEAFGPPPGGLYGALRTWVPSCTSCRAPGGVGIFWGFTWLAGGTTRFAGCWTWLCVVGFFALSDGEPGMVYKRTCWRGVYGLRIDCKSLPSRRVEDMKKGAN